MDVEFLLAQQEIINKLLRIKTDGRSYVEIFDEALSFVVKAPWMKLSQKGEFFLRMKSLKV